MFRSPEFRFSGLAENLGNLPPLPPFDPLVEVLKRPAQMLTQGAANAALARAHESDQHHGPRREALPACRSLAPKHTHALTFGWLLRTPFAPIRFAFRFSYCFFRSVS
jgi:hypothetical protein